MTNNAYILEESLGYLVGRAARSLGASLNRNFHEAGYDVTCEQWSILVNLAERNGQSQQELAGVTCKDKTSMTRLIDGMEKHNLVVRVPDKSDRRQKLIYLTNKGKQFRQKLVKVTEMTLRQAEGGIHTKELAHCKDILKKIYANLIEKNSCTSNLKKT